MANALNFAVELPEDRDLWTHSRLELVARLLVSRQYLMWHDFVFKFDPAVDAQFRAIVAYTLYSGFTASDVARATRFDPATIIRWVEGSTAPPRVEVREKIKSDLLKLIIGRVQEGADGFAPRKPWKRSKSEDLQPLDVIDVSAARERLDQLVRRNAARVN